MDKSRLAQLNRSLGTALGMTPSGEPEYKWFHAKDLRSEIVEAGKIISLPQIPESLRGDGPSMTAPAHRYALAKWMPPQMPKEQWDAMFGGEIPYPRGGSYQATDIILHIGVEPTERLTDEVIGKVKAFRQLSAGDIKSAMDEGRAQTRRTTDAEISDRIADRIPYPGHVPGKKDNVSYGR